MNFSVRKVAICGEWNVLDVEYPDAPDDHNVIVIHQDDFQAAAHVRRLNLHYSDSRPCPIARFEPTKRGWDMAVAFAKAIADFGVERC